MNLPIQRASHKVLWRFASLQRKHPGVLAGVSALAAVMLSVAAFYLTPLHFVNVVEPPIQRQTPSTVHAATQERSSDYLFIDVRNKSAYDAEHAEGSVNIPIHDFYDDRHVLPRKGKIIVLICGDSKLAGVAYGYLQLYGFRNLVLVDGGLAQWRAEGLPTVRYVEKM